MLLEEIREDSKRRFYNAIDSRNVKIMDSVMQLLRNRMYDIMHNPEIASIKGAYDVYEMLDNFDRTLNDFRFCVSHYGK